MMTTRISYSHPLAKEVDQQLQQLTYEQWYSETTSAQRDLLNKIDTLCREHLPNKTTTDPPEKQVWRRYMRLYCELIEILKCQAFEFLKAIYTHLPELMRDRSIEAIGCKRGSKCTLVPIHRWSNGSESLLAINVKVCDVVSQLSYKSMEVLLDPLRLQLCFMRSLDNTSASERERLADAFNYLWHKKLSDRECMVPLLHRFVDPKGSSVTIWKYCAGGDLYDWFSGSGKRASLLHRCQIAHQILKHIAALHCQESKEHGIVHGDLKIDNVTLTRKGHVKLIDWEYAAVRGQARRRLLNPEENNNYKILHQKTVGTDLYLARELMNDSVEKRPHRGHLFRADVWALGWILSVIFQPETDEKLEDWLDAGREQIQKGCRAGNAYFQQRDLYRQLRADCEQSPIDSLIVKCLHPSPRKRLKSQEALSLFEEHVWKPQLETPTSLSRGKVYR